MSCTSGAAALHAEGQLERRDAAFERLILAGLFQAIAVHLLDQVELEPLQRRERSRRS